MDLRDVREFLIDSAKYLAVFAVVLLIGLFVISFQQVVGPSMNDTLHEDDVVMVNKLVYKFRNPKRGEIVSVSIKDRIMVKRIIGLPGETIEFKNNILYINGEAFEDEYAYTPTDDFKLSLIGEETIPDDYYLVLGDNRANSEDSRKYGLIKKSEIKGKVFIRLFPFSNIKTF